MKAFRYIVKTNDETFPVIILAHTTYAAKDALMQHFGSETVLKYDSTTEIVLQTQDQHVVTVEGASHE